MTAKSHRVTLKIDGETFVVDIRDVSSSPVEVVVNGQVYEVHVNSGSPDNGEPTSESPPPRAPRIARRQQELPGDGRLGREVLAPMPGDILDIQVSPGDRVSAGQPLCSLEAMKMKNTIRAGREGVIDSVHVNEGQTVAHGDLLMSFE